jgi:hypothetical protein
MNNFFSSTLSKTKEIFSRITATAIHNFRQTILIDVYLPAHEERTTTYLFEKTRKQLIERENGKCHICGRTEEQSGHPLEAHHHPIERSLTNSVDWNLVRKDFPDFDWNEFDEKGDPYLFVDNMLVNGMLLCKDHHTGLNEGIHFTTYPFFIIQRYMKSGYKYSDTETITHENK